MEEEIKVPVLDFAAISAAAVESDNTSVDSSGDFKRPVPVAGATLGRVREYLELGKFNPDATGIAKGYSASQKGYLVIELLHKRHMYEMGDKLVPHEVKIYFNKGIKATSNYKKLFKQLNAATGGSAKTFVDLLNKPFKARVTLNVVGAGTPAEKTYANLDNYEAPCRENDDGDMVDVNVPELVGKQRLFLWENKTVSDDMIRAMWASIQNDGTYTKNAGKDNETTESLNFDQMRIMENTQWEGSHTQSLFHVEDIDLGDAPAVPLDTTERDAEANDGMPSITDGEPNF